MRLRAWPWLAAVLALLLPASAFPQSMTLCRAKPELLELGNSLPAARKAIAERKQLRIIALGSSSTSGYGVSNPAYAYPAQLKMGLDKALPGVDVDVVNRGIGGQDVEEMAARMQAEMKENPASLVVWQTGTNAAIRQMPLDEVHALAAQRPGARQVAGRRLRADEPAIRAGRRRRARQGSLREGHGRGGQGVRCRPVPPLRHHARLVPGRHALRAVRAARRPAPQRLRPEVHRQASRPGRS